ncbi:hypothetical protein FXO37_22550 [Capsicum annuum]|nr:hypothetical protein FXO37_22550 [Capsicum annuum]
MHSLLFGDLRHFMGRSPTTRMTLLLGPPGSGKAKLLKALAGVLDKDLRVNGRISYCGRELSDFIPQRTCAYISQHGIHHGEMTVRETLDFAGRIKPDPEIDAFMKATAVAGQESSLVTNYVLKLGELCEMISTGRVSVPVQEKSYYALAAFCENMGEEILPFLNPLMGKLLGALQSSPRKLQETCMVKDRTNFAAFH